MLLSPRRDTTTADLLRLLAVWLAVIVLLQGVTAARALGAGPLHHHRQGDTMHVAAVAGTHHHDGDEHHHHAVGDTSVVRLASADDAFDAAAFALAAAMALMALGLAARASPARRRQPWQAAPGWAWCTATPAASRRPPRPR